MPEQSRQAEQRRTRGRTPAAYRPPSTIRAREIATTRCRRPGWTSRTTGPRAAADRHVAAELDGIADPLFGADQQRAAGQALRRSSAAGSHGGSRAAPARKRHSYSSQPGIEPAGQQQGNPQVEVQHRIVGLQAQRGAVALQGLRPAAAVPSARRPGCLAPAHRAARASPPGAVPPPPPPAGPPAAAPGPGCCTGPAGPACAAARRGRRPAPPPAVRGRSAHAPSPDSLRPSCACSRSAAWQAASAASNLAQRQQRGRAVDVEHGGRRLDRDRLVDAGHRRLRLAALRGDHAQHVQAVGMSGRRGE